MDLMNKWSNEQMNPCAHERIDGLLYGMEDEQTMRYDGKMNSKIQVSAVMDKYILRW